MRGIVPPHLKSRFDALDQLQPASPPLPWHPMSVLPIGGLTNVGFADSSDLLLVISSMGKGVVDCRAGTLIAREDDDDFEFDIGNLTVAGIGPITDKTVRTAGMHGGGLPLRTVDGWALERHPLAWPDDELFLSQSGQSMFWTPAGQPLALTKLAGFISEVRAFGFSPTGRSFIIATTSDVTVYGR